MRGTKVWRSSACALVTVVVSVGIVGVEAASAAPLPIVVGAVKVVPGNVDPSAVACPTGHAVTASTCYVLSTTSTASLVTEVVNSNPKSPSISVTGGVAIACESVTTCAVVGSSLASKGTIVWIVNGHVAKTVMLMKSSYLNGVACTATSCVVVGELYGPSTKTGLITYGVVARVTEAQSAPSATRVNGVAAFNGVACPTTTACIAVGSTTSTVNGVGAIVPLTNGHPGARTLAAGNDALERVSCGTPTSCWATGTAFNSKTGITSTLVELTNGKPSPHRAGPKVGGAISCVSATTCFVGAGTSTYGHGLVDEYLNGALVKAVVVAPFAYGALAGITCPTPTACLATGPTGFHNPGPSYYYTGGVVTIHV